jgi:myo-inositol-1(or 4)-monophosphatase
VPDQQHSDAPQTDPAQTAALYDELLDIALEAARRAGTLLRDGRPADLGVAATKSSPIDVVTEMDIASEKLITGFIGERRPDDGFLGEEGASTDGTSGVRWVIDPVDGTVNYLYGLPSWSVSIAAEIDGEVVVGVVAAPMRGETYQAVLGRGAYNNGERIGTGPPRRSPRHCSAPASPTSPSAGRPRPRYCARWCHRSVTSGAAARPRSTCAMWPAAGSMPTTSAV